MTPRRLLSALGTLVLALVGGGLVLGATTYHRFRPVAITLGPTTTLYFHAPTLDTRVHEAIHRRQMRDKSAVGRVVSALRYTTDYRYRLDEEAEAKAGELCLQIHRFSSELPAYTTARSRSQAEAYRAWAWERMGDQVADRVGAQLESGQRCADILRGVTLDLPPGTPLSGQEAVRLATFQFLQSFGSSGTDQKRLKARIALAGWADPVRWQLPPDVPDFDLVGIAEAQATPLDSTITATAAGQALHRLTYATAERMYTQLAPPLPGYRGSRLLDPTRAVAVTGIPVEDWSDRLVARALEGELDASTLDYLAELDAHPANADLATFALASDADIVGTRYRLPIQVGWGRIVPSDLQPLREALRAQYGRAALALARGDRDAGERILRTALAASVQLVRSAPFEVDVLEGMRLMGETLDGLERVLVAEGREGEVTWRGTRQSRGGWARRGARPALFSADPEVLFRALPVLARDADVPIAFRRFAYRQVALWDVCLGRRLDPLSRARHESWTRQVEAGLAAREGDADLLAAIRSTVRGLLEASAVPPAQICAPTRAVLPETRVAIMSAPPRLGSRAAEDAY